MFDHPSFDRKYLVKVIFEPTKDERIYPLPFLKGSLLESKIVNNHLIIPLEDETIDQFIDVLNFSEYDYNSTNFHSHLNLKQLSELWKMIKKYELVTCKYNFCQFFFKKTESILKDKHSTKEQRQEALSYRNIFLEMHQKLNDNERMPYDFINRLESMLNFIPKIKT